MTITKQDQRVEAVAEALWKSEPVIYSWGPQERHLVSWQDGVERNLVGVKIFRAFAEAALAAADRVSPLEPQGLDEPCFYCGESCEPYAGDPGRWPIPLCHRDDPGVTKWHHSSCVTDRLIENQFDRVSPDTAGEQYVEWTEPFGDGSEPVVSRMKVADVIAVQKRRQEYKDRSDQEALDDFIVVHWATRVHDTATAVKALGPNADAWHLYLCERLDNRATCPNGLTSAALWICDCIEAAVKTETERCEKAIKDWLAIFASRGPIGRIDGNAVVSAQTWANDAMCDVLDAIRKGAKP